MENPIPRFPNPSALKKNCFQKKKRKKRKQESSVRLQDAECYKSRRAGEGKRSPLCACSRRRTLSWLPFWSVSNENRYSSLLKIMRYNEPNLHWIQTCMYPFPEISFLIIHMEYPPLLILNHTYGMKIKRLKKINRET